MTLLGGEKHLLLFLAFTLLAIILASAGVDRTDLRRPRMVRRCWNHSTPWPMFCGTCSNEDVGHKKGQLDKKYSFSLNVNGKGVNRVSVDGRTTSQSGQRHYSSNNR